MVDLAPLDAAIDWAANSPNWTQYHFAAAGESGQFTGCVIGRVLYDAGYFGENFMPSDGYLSPASRILGLEQSLVSRLATASNSLEDIRRIRNEIAFDNGLPLRTNWEVGVEDTSIESENTTLTNVVITLPSGRKFVYDFDLSGEDLLDFVNDLANRAGKGL